MALEPFLDLFLDDVRAVRRPIVDRGPVEVSDLPSVLLKQLVPLPVTLALLPWW
jgi:hypothetical protein